MDRSEARRRLESTTAFVMVGKRLVVRSVRVLDLITSGPAEDSTDKSVRLEVLKLYEARKQAA